MNSALDSAPQSIHDAPQSAHDAAPHAPTTTAAPAGGGRSGDLSPRSESLVIAKMRKSVKQVIEKRRRGRRVSVGSRRRRPSTRRAARRADRRRSGTRSTGFGT
jgi:hypothetical protein